MWAVAVLACPFCGSLHQHRAGNGARLMTGQTFRRCPSTGALYRLRPVLRSQRVVSP
ncbi:hypothetical protein ACIODS_04220 [Micromonospora chalcea]|uniref:hypothetical protein n=1 Tax=Micromonospora chalcea TaxID=1874 RepID=UPI00380D39EB